MYIHLFRNAPSENSRTPNLARIKMSDFLAVVRGRRRTAEIRMSFKYFVTSNVDSGFSSKIVRQDSSDCPTTSTIWMFLSSDAVNKNGSTASGLTLTPLDRAYGYQSQPQTRS